jgi:hypothetical protein
MVLEALLEAVWPVCLAAEAAVHTAELLLYCEWPSRSAHNPENHRWKG